MSVLGRTIHPARITAYFLITSLSVVLLTLHLKQPVIQRIPTTDTNHNSGLVVSQQKPTQITQQDWLNAINIERQKAGVAPLKLDPRLTASAERKAVEMSAEGLDDTPHVNNQGVAGKTYIKEAWSTCLSGGENIIWNNQNVGQAVSWWMNSPTHRANILNPNFTFTGFGSAGIFTTEHFCGQ